MTRSREPRLMIYSQDGLGLGHLRRTTLLATEFLRACPGASALTVSDSPLGQFFTTLPGHDYLKLPSIRKAGPGDWRPVSLGSPLHDVLELRKDIIRSAVSRFEPHVLLVDHMPHGALGELLPALRAPGRRPARVILGMRDILDSPQVVRERWTAEGAYRAVEDHYDDVLVYGSRDIFDVSSEYAFSPPVTAKLRYCGYVCAPPTRLTPQRIRTRYLRGAPDKKLLVAMAGGGADAFPLFAALLDALPGILAHLPCQLVIVTGPFLPRAQRLALVQRSRALPVHLLTTVPESLSYLAAADLTVAMAGYNTTAEILSLGVPALLVPRAGPSAEQQTRARLFAERGWVRWLPPGHLDTGRLAPAVLTALAQPGAAPGSPGPDLSGRETAAAHLLETLAGSSGDVAARGVPRTIASADKALPVQSSSRVRLQA